MIRVEWVLRFLNHIHSWNSLSFVFVIDKVIYPSCTEGDCLDSYLFFERILYTPIHILYLQTILLFSRFRLWNFGREAYAHNFEFGRFELLPFSYHFIFGTVCDILRLKNLNLVVEDPSRIYITLFRLYF